MVIMAATAVRAAVAAGTLAPDDRAGPPMARRSPLARRTASRSWPVDRQAAAAACLPVGRRRWPAGLPAAAGPSVGRRRRTLAGRLSAAAGPPDRQAVPAAADPPVGCLRPARVEAALSADAAGACCVREPVQPCSQCSRRRAADTCP